MGLQDTTDREVAVILQGRGLGFDRRVAKIVLLGLGVTVLCGAPLALMHNGARPKIAAYTVRPLTADALIEAGRQRGVTTNIHVGQAPVIITSTNAHSRGRLSRTKRQPRIKPLRDITFANLTGPPARMKPIHPLRGSPQAFARLGTEPAAGSYHRAWSVTAGLQTSTIPRDQGRVDLARTERSEALDAIWSLRQK